MIDEIKKLNRYKIASEVILPNRIYDEIIETVNLGKVLEILDNQPDYKSAWNELKESQSTNCAYVNLGEELEVRFEELEQKYNLGGE